MISNRSSICRLSFLQFFWDMKASCKTISAVLCPHRLCFSISISEGTNLGLSDCQVSSQGGRSRTEWTASHTYGSGRQLSINGLPLESKTQAQAREELLGEIRIPAAIQVSLLMFAACYSSISVPPPLALTPPPSLRLFMHFYSISSREQGWLFTGNTENRDNLWQTKDLRRSEFNHDQYFNQVDFYSTFQQQEGSKSFTWSKQHKHIISNYENQ